MEFEFDQGKSDSNEEKHGISFVEAQNLWCDEYRMVVELEHKGEQRYMIVANYGGGLWSTIYVIRAQRVRIISARRATKNEVSFYDKCKSNYC